MAGWQALLLIVAAGAVAAWLFLIKIRPPRINVPSLLFWRRVLDQKRDETWWERIRRAVSLAATVLIAVALAMAVARPGPRAASTSRGKMLIVLDSSWSMLKRRPAAARDGIAPFARRGRWRPRRGDDVALATTADGLVEGPTSDLALIETALERLAPTGGASAPWPRVGGADTVHFFDGRGAFPQPRSFRRRASGTRRRRTPPSPRSTRDPPPGHGRRPGVSGDRQLLATRAEGARLDHARHRGGVRSTRDACRGRSGSTGRAAHRGRRSAAACQISAPSDALSIDDEAVAWIQGAEPLTRRRERKRAAR